MCCCISRMPSRDLTPSKTPWSEPVLCLKRSPSAASREVEPDAYAAGLFHALAPDRWLFSPLQSTERDQSEQASTTLPSAPACLAPGGSGTRCLKHPAFCPGRVFHQRATLGPGGQRAGPRWADWWPPGWAGALPGAPSACVDHNSKRHLRRFSTVASPCTKNRTSVGRVYTTRAPLPISCTGRLYLWLLPTDHCALTLDGQYSGYAG